MFFSLSEIEIWCDWLAVHIHAGSMPVSLNNIDYLTFNTSTETPFLVFFDLHCYFNLSQRYNLLHYTANKAQK